MVQAAGIRLDLNGPRPVAPPHSLLNTPGVVVEDEGRWLNGVVLNGYPEDCPSLWEPCLTGTFREKDEGGEHSTPTFDPFVVYSADTCSSFGHIDLVERVEATLEATQSAGVEQALVTGVSGSSNPYFADTNLTVLGGAAVLATVGLSWLENAIAATCRKGMIWATPAIIAALDNNVRGGSDGPLMTANGTPVVSMSVLDVDPDGAAGDAGDGQDYMFATGPVEVRLGPIATTNIRESLERDTNTITIRSERFVLATWDTALQAAVLVDWAP